MTDPRRTPLYDRHSALGASFIDFEGWRMPVRYTSDLAEHRAVREAAGLFDLSHMAEFFVEGAGAGAFLDYAVTGRLSTAVEGQAVYTLLLHGDGGIIDDLIVYRSGPERYIVVANASNRHAVAAALADRVAGFAVTVTDGTDDIALLAVQGPAAEAVVEATGAIRGLRDALSELAPFRLTRGEFVTADGSAVPVHISRTGYTGEDGFELFTDAAAAEPLWDALLAAGAPFGLTPAGLAARDTLRLEAGMPLYGQELSLDVVPSQVGLGRFVAADKHDYVGKAALESVIATGARVLVGLESEGKRAGRRGYGVFHDDVLVGEVTSGALSPTLGHPIAMAFVSPVMSRPGTTLSIDVRGSRVPATVTPLPFYRRKK